MGRKRDEKGSAPSRGRSSPEGALAMKVTNRFAKLSRPNEPSTQRRPLYASATEAEQAQQIIIDAEG